MNKVIAILVLLLVVAVGCTQGASESTQDVTEDKESGVMEKSDSNDLSGDLEALDEDEDLGLGDLEDLDLEIDESIFE
jgi:uncharacterized protein YpmB|tara:strand:- start:2110 stop:2343 length:234 start_codon:yes stop_codon:yes gene_type:complete